MQPFIRHRGLVVPLERANIDTDQIIPKQFLKRVERSGFGQYLFYDWRFDGDGKPRADFVLNRPEYREASILLAGPNFGCGSSREHAPWALADYGFRVIIAPSFADIFYQNCFKNGLLPVVVDEAIVNQWFESTRSGSLYLDVDLERLKISPDDGTTLNIQIDPYKRTTLLEGLDDIQRTLTYASRIEAFEKAHSS